MKRRAMIFAGGVLAAALLGGLAMAQTFESPGGDPSINERDPVTGYLCVTPACDTVRMSEAPCICQKQNPGETRLSNLRLECVIRKDGAWAACPVKPRYGRMVN